MITEIRSIFAPNSADRAGSTDAPHLENFDPKNIGERATYITALNAQLVAMKRGDTLADQRDEIVARRKAMQGFQTVARKNQRNPYGPRYR